MARRIFWTFLGIIFVRIYYTVNFKIDMLSALPKNTSDHVTIWAPALLMSKFRKQSDVQIWILIKIIISWFLVGFLEQNIWMVEFFSKLVLKSVVRSIYLVSPNNQTLAYSWCYGEPFSKSANSSESPSWSRNQVLMPTTAFQVP